jgi:hypothetical protein
MFRKGGARSYENGVENGLWHDICIVCWRQGKKEFEALIRENTMLGERRLMEGQVVRRGDCGRRRRKPDPETGNKQEAKQGTIQMSNRTYLFVEDNLKVAHCSLIMARGC